MAMASDSTQYADANAFRRALEDRLQNVARERSIPLERLRKRITFDRLLARLFDRRNPKPQWILKGGYALEFRFHNIARTTKDVDFSMPHSHNADAYTIRTLLQNEAKKDLSDGFVFYIGVPVVELAQAVYGGWRYPVEARVANRVFTKFHIDVGLGDAVISEVEWKQGEASLQFAGIEPAFAAILPLEQHFAEKIHAFSYPRDKRPFSRIRDLVDLVLIIEQGLPEPQQVLSAIKATFERRNTHNFPQTLEPPPIALGADYKQLAADCGVTKKTMAEAFAFLREYWVVITQ
ncbi:MAG: hypothetical protein A2Y14_05240 [Verrucomicrobia bacterium GWF2_51_19]|nr:MAG: hypothetical protein A2Y14_05240 [Verrucomicrobia bacterium GWF2_51_19]HCJ12345.1 hypothetical protein [Opitutae bacterium]